MFYNAIYTNPVGFSYNKPLPTEMFSSQLLHERTQNGKPYLTDYIAKQIYELSKPTIFTPPSQPIFTELELLPNRRVDPESPIVQCGYLILNSDGSINPNSQSVKDGYIQLFKGNTLDRKSEVYKEAEKRMKEKYHMNDDSSQVSIQNTNNFYRNVNMTDRNDLIVSILKQFNDPKNILIFVTNPNNMSQIFEVLKKSKIFTASIYEKMKKEDRENKFDGFQKGKIKVLILTDRNTRIKGKGRTLVINYDMPQNPQSFLARVQGSRASITFVSSGSDDAMLRQIQQELSININDLPDNFNFNTIMGKKQ